MKITRQRESKRDCKLIYWCDSMIAIYTFVCLAQIYSRTYNLTSKTLQSQVISESHSKCTGPKRRKIPISFIQNIFICGFPSVSKEEGHFGKDKWIVAYLHSSVLHYWHVLVCIISFIVNNISLKVMFSTLSVICQWYLIFRDIRAFHHTGLEQFSVFENKYSFLWIAIHSNIDSCLFLGWHCLL